MPETVTVGEETVLTLAYVNKGRGDISNVEAVVEGDGVDTPARTQYLGNIIAGGSGNIGFALTPNQEGEIPLTLKIAYENADQQLVTPEFPVTLQAEEPPMLEETDFEEPEASGGHPLAGGGPGDTPEAGAAVGRCGCASGRRRRRPRRTAAAGTTGTRRRAVRGVSVETERSAAHCLQNLLRRKSRTFLTVLGVLIGCCSIVIMVALGIGMKQNPGKAAGGDGRFDHRPTVNSPPGRPGKRSWTTPWCAAAALEGWSP
jgi:hypothetical protein